MANLHGRRGASSRRHSPTRRSCTTPNLDRRAQWRLRALRAALYFVHAKPKSSLLTRGRPTPRHRSSDALDTHCPHPVPAASPGPGVRHLCRSISRSWK